MAQINSNINNEKNESDMKNYCVSVDITMAKNIYVDAENEEHAISKVREMINNNPYEHACNFSHYVDFEIIDAYEED